jgi:long-chain fatty acid transport protein
MTLRTRFSLVLGTGLGLASLALSGDASASGYLTSRFGADHGTPSTPNAFAIYFNPAALGGTKGTSITGDAAILLRWAAYNRTAEALSPSDQALLSDGNYTASNSGKGELLNLLALPFLGVNSDFGTKWLHGGWAMYIPFGGLAQWNGRDSSFAPSFAPNVYKDVPGTKDGPQRWHNISGQILAIYNTFALAGTVPIPSAGRLSLGVNFSPIVHHVATIRARNLNGSDDTFSAAGKLVEGRSLLNVWGFNVGMTFGLYYEPLDDERLKLGVSYISQPGFGETRMQGDLEQVLGTSPPGDKTKVALIQEYPDIVRFGANYRFHKRWEVRSDFEFVRWSTFKQQCVVNTDNGNNPNQKCDVGPRGEDRTNGKVILNIPNNWRDAVGMRLGASHFAFEDKLELFGSLGFTTSAVPVETINAAAIDSFRIYATAGARYVFSKHFALAGSYNHIAFVDVNTIESPGKGRSALYAGYSEPSRSPSADGQYRSQIGFLNVNFQYTF